MNFIRQILHDDFIMASNTRQNNTGLGTGLMFRRPRSGAALEGMPPMITTGQPIYCQWMNCVDKGECDY